MEGTERHVCIQNEWRGVRWESGTYYKMSRSQICVLVAYLGQLVGHWVQYLNRFTCRDEIVKWWLAIQPSINSLHSRTWILCSTGFTMRLPEFTASPCTRYGITLRFVFIFANPPGKYMHNPLLSIMVPVKCTSRNAFAIYSWGMVFVSAEVVLLQR